MSVSLRGFVCACLRPMGCCYAAHLREAGLAAVVVVAVHRKVAVAAVEDTTVVVGRVAAVGEQTRLLLQLHLDIDLELVAVVAAAVVDSTFPPAVTRQVVLWLTW